MPKHDLRGSTEAEGAILTSISLMSPIGTLWVSGPMALAELPMFQQSLRRCQRAVNARRQPNCHLTLTRSTELLRLANLTGYGK